MALARIITRSQPCARQLALDLLARGYAVEIVSPDKIPDNLADLELRVDAGPGNQLIANVESHDGERSASLDFVHHLKAPMVDFIRRPAESAGPIDVTEVPIFDGEPSLEDVDLPVEVSPLEPVTSSLVSPILQKADFVVVESTIPPMPEAVAVRGDVRISVLPAEIDDRYSVAENLPALIAEIPLEEAQIEQRPIEKTIIEPSVIDLSALELPENRVVEKTTLEKVTVDEPVVKRTTIVEKTTVGKTDGERSPVAQHDLPNRPRPITSRPNPSFVRPVLTLAAVVLLALLLGFGLRRSGKAAAQVSVPEQGIAGASNVSSNLAAPASSTANISATAPMSVQNKSVQLPAQNVEESSHPATDPSTASKSTTAIAASPRRTRAAVSRKYNGELVAHDTVTYLDPRFKPAPKSKGSKQTAAVHPISHKRGGGVVAANKVTYLDQTPAAKSPE